MKKGKPSEAVMQALKQRIRDKLIEHRQYIARYGEDLPEIREWTWRPGAPGAPTRAPRREPA